MLLNFCDSRLRPEISCDTVTTEGYEANNLINNSVKGFLAYACIKPPINIDLTFICNVRINHILIWPCVGSQKSSGFQLYAKTTNDASTPYVLLSTGYLNSCDSGVLFYPSNVDHEKIVTPTNFLKRYIKISLNQITSYTNSLRLCICKTENSVPAVGRIEVWGTVSPRCGKDIMANVHALWLQPPSPLPFHVAEINCVKPVSTTINGNSKRTSLHVPEAFLDAITYEIMTQPVALPSGNIIDQSTLQKYEESEALWGRVLSDPFTGIPFNDHRKPVVAAVLKSRIDKFLLEHSDSDEIKKLPRVLGHEPSTKVTVITENMRMTRAQKYSSKENVLKNDTNNMYTAKGRNSITESDSKKRKWHCHQLPVQICPQPSSFNCSRVPKIKKAFVSNTFPHVNNSFTDHNKDISADCTGDSGLGSNIETDVQDLLNNLKRFNTQKESKQDNAVNNCICCEDAIFYQLPCKHIVCRNVLTSIKNCKCKFCGIAYKKNEVERIHQ